MSLAGKTLRSALWMMARVAGRQLANAVLFFWLAAILSPADLGIASLSVTLPMLLLPMVIRGIRDAVIQRPDLDDTLLDTAFIVNAFYGLVLTATLAALAPLIARLYGDARLLPLSLAASALPFLAALGNLQEALCERHFRHKRITLIYLVSSMISVGVAILVALNGQEIWALVTFNLCSYSSVTILMWLFSDWRPKGRWSMREAWTQIRFAAPIVLSQTIATGNQRIVELLIGALINPAAVAFFRFGGNFTRLLNQIIVTPIIQVLMPAFARSKSTPETNLSRALVVNSAVLFPVFMGAATVIPDFVSAVFGPQWSLGGQVGRILCYGVFASLIGPAAYPLLIVQGKGHWTAILSSTALVVTICGVAIGAGFGTLGAAAGFVLRGLLTIPMTFFVVHRAIGVRPLAILSAFMPFALLSLAVHGVLLLGLPLLESVAVYPRIAVTLFLGLGLYIVGLRVLIKRLAPLQYQTLVGFFPGKVKRLF